MSLKKNLFSFVFMALCASCSWEYHRSHFKKDYRNLQPDEYHLETRLLPLDDGQNCTVKEYYDLKERRYYANYNYPNGDQIDSAFHEEGHLSMVSLKYLATAKNFLYDSTLSYFYDSKSRPLSKSVHKYYPDSVNEYWQYFNENGSLDSVKHPIIYSVL
jgi:hypothetical protein